MKSSEFIDSDIPSSDLSKEVLSNGSRSYPHSSSQNTNGKAELDQRVEQARHQMLELKRQQDQLEKEKLELEDLRRREESFEEGKTEALNELARIISMIEQEEFELHKRATLLSNCRESFQDHQRLLTDIRESDWTSSELKVELNKAFLVLDAAKAELNRGRAQLSSLSDQSAGFSENLENRNVSHSGVRDLSHFNFILEFKRGLARNLSLILLAVLALLFYYLKNS